MNSDPAVISQSYATSQAAGVRYQEVVLSNNDTSGRPLAKDWETWIVRIAAWVSCAGNRDSDGVVWPTAAAIQSAFRLIRQMRTQGISGPTDLVPSGDGGIVLSRRTGNVREEIEISDSGDTELFLFEDGRLTNRTPW